MQTLVDKLGSKALQQKRQSPVTASPQAQVSLSKVIEAKLGVNQSKKSKWEEHQYYSPILQKDDKTAEDMAILNQGMADLCLVVLDKGLLRPLTHLQLEEYWNIIGDIKRLQLSIYKPYWLGSGHEIRLDDVNLLEGDSVDKLAEHVSNILIEDIVNSVLFWKENKKLYKERLDDTKKAIPKGTWYDIYVRGWSGVGLQYSTYRYKLLKSLVDNGTIPDGIPEDVLSTYEREEILKRLGFTKPKSTSKSNKIGDS